MKRFHHKVKQEKARQLRNASESKGKQGNTTTNIQKKVNQNMQRSEARESKGEQQNTRKKQGEPKENQRKLVIASLAVLASLASAAGEKEGKARQRKSKQGKAEQSRGEPGHARESKESKSKQESNQGQARTIN